MVERTGEVAGLPTHWREAPGDGRPPILYLHGVPTASWDWIRYLERIGGVAPDLPGFGKSAKPADFDYTIDGCLEMIEHSGHWTWIDRPTSSRGRRSSWARRRRGCGPSYLLPGFATGRSR